MDFLAADIPVSSEYIKRYSNSSSKADIYSDNIINDAAGIEEMLSAKAGYNSIDLVAGLAEDSPDIIKLLMRYSLSTDKTLSFRASYVLTRVQENAGNKLKPWYGEILKSLPGLKNESVIRSFLKIVNLAGVDQLSKDDHGLLADRCFTILNDGKSAIAIKAYSMEALYNLTQKISRALNRACSYN